MGWIQKFATKTLNKKQIYIYDIVYVAERRQGNHHKKKEKLPRQFSKVIATVRGSNHNSGKYLHRPQKESSLRLYRAVNSYTAAAQPQEEFFLGLYRALNGYTAAVQPQEESSLRLCRAVYGYTAAKQRLYSHKTNPLYGCVWSCTKKCPQQSIKGS